MNKWNETKKKKKLKKRNNTNVREHKIITFDGLIKIELEM